MVSQLTFSRTSVSMQVIKKSASFVLALFLLLSDVHRVFAEEISSESEISVESNQLTETFESVPVEKEFHTEEMSIADETLPDPSVMSFMSAINDEGEITQTMTSGVGSLNNVRVQENTGALSYTYPLRIPQGRGSTQPNLLLEYNSQSRTDMSPFGYGWNISIPYIERINKTGIDKMYSTTTPFFSSSISGELVQVGSTTEYKSRAEQGSFLKYELTGSVWVMSDKQGTKFYFGTTSNSRNDDPSDSAKVYRWMLERSEDTNGNFVTYSYSKHLGMIYPKGIEYTNTGTTSGLFKISFSTTTSSTSVSYQGGFRMKRDYVISNVTIAENNQNIHSYNLRYGIGTNDGRNTLLGVTEVGYTPTVSLPETTFEYGGTQLPSWSTATSTNFPEPLSEYDLGTRMGDLNGDGLTDVVRYYQKSDYDNSNPANDYNLVVRRVHINKGDGTWDIDVPWGWDDIHVPLGYWQDGVLSNTLGTYDLGARLIDVNGDGRDDYVVGFGCIPSGPTCEYLQGFSFPAPQMGVYLNTGSGFVKQTDWTVPALVNWHESRSVLSNGASMLVDVNGDGLPDSVTAYFNSYTNGNPRANASSSVSLNTGAGWIQSNLAFPYPLAYKADTYGVLSFKDVGTRLADVNGDSLVDVLRGHRDDTNGSFDPQMDEQNVYINTGNGWATTSEFSLPVNFVEANFASKGRGKNVIDIQGDGLPDIFEAYYNENNSNYESYLYLNTGTGWAEKTYNLSQPFALHTGYTLYDTGKALIDFDGDTIVDVWDLNFTDQVATQTSAGSVMLNNAEIPDLLTGIKFSTGGELSLEYDGYLDTVQQSYAQIGTSTVNPIVLSHIDYDSAHSNTWSHDYAYKRGYFNYASTSFRDRKFAGFETVTKTTGLGKEITQYHQGDISSSTNSELEDRYVKIGQRFRTDFYDLSNNLYKRIVTKWDSATTSSPAAFVYTSRELTRNYDGDGDTKDVGMEYTYTSYGNPSKVTEWGEVTGDSDGTFSDTGSDKRITQYGYATSTSPYIVGLPSSEVVLDQSGTKVRESRYYYDSQSLGSVTKGNRTKDERWITSSSYASSTRSYNAYGLVTSETDPRGKTTSYIYDSYNLYPATSTNALSQSSKYAYDYSSGKVATTTDANGLVTAVVYDGLDRVTEEKVPDSTTGTLVTKAINIYSDGYGTSSILTTRYLNSGSTTNEYAYLDGFGREIQKRTQAEDGGLYIAKDTVYGTNGLVSKESLPYFSSGTSRTTATTSNALFTAYGYDALGRVASSTSVVGTTLTTRDQWKETVTDVLGKLKDFTYDAYGRLTKVTEHNSTTTYDTSYEWDHNNNLTKVTDALANLRMIAYDGLSRRTSLQDLHASGDATYGTWTFSYDNSGNLTSKVDPKSQTINYTYDDINRPLTEDYTGSSTTEVRYTYDSCTRGIGRLCTGVNSGATTTYAYTYLGLPGTTTRTISGTAYTMKQVYDRQGNQTSVVYPDSSEVQYTYNTQGLPETVLQKESGGSWKTVVSDLDYGPHGLLTYQKNGNNTETWKTYDASELYRLRTIVTTATTTGGTGGPGDGFQAIEAELLSTPTSEEVATETVTEETPTTTDEIVETEDVTGTSTEHTSEVTEETTEGGVATTTPSTTPEFTLDLSIQSTTTIPILDTALTTPETATTSLALPELFPEVKVDTKAKDKLITSSHEARSWQNFHRERVAGLIREGAPQEEIDSALYAQDQLESYLLGKGYTKEKKGEVRSQAKEFFEKTFKNVLEEIISFMLPETVYAYLFGSETFESCSSLPCTFTNHSTWGSVAGSLDSTNKAVGVKSFKTVVTGEGSAALESTNYSRDEIWVQFKVYIPSNIAWGASNYFSILRYEDTADGLVFSMNVENSSSNARLTMSGDTLSWTNTGLNLTKGATNTIEVRFKKGTSNGDVDIWLNNSTQGSPSYNGSGTLNTGTDNVDDILIGMRYAPENGISTLYFDDYTIDSAFIGTASGGGGSPTEPFRSKLQGLTYTYDVAGNITQIVDSSLTKTSATTSYQYDDLYRLTRASTTLASTTPYVQTYTYNAIGNLITKSDVGTYSYDSGGSETTQAIYSDSIAGGWSDWSWSTTLNTSNTSPVAVGTYSLKATYASAWAGMSLHNNSVNSSPYTKLRLRVNVGTSTSAGLYAYFTNSGGTALQVVTLSTYVPGGFQANTWHTIEIPLSDLLFTNYNNATNFTVESSQSAVIYYDQIELVGTSGGGSTYANPHASTNINGLSQSYDNNGNLASTSQGHLNTWNYQNRLIQSQGGGTATTTYLYDETGQRTSKTSNSVTTHYPFPLYEAQGATTTKHIYAGDTLVATIQSDTPSPKTYYNHQDHLGSTNVVSTPDGYLDQEYAYYPFGSARIDQQYGKLDQTLGYIGKTTDSETSYSYLTQRYADTGKGRFISQDPALFMIGGSDKKAEIALIGDPQQLNTYSYARNNPVLFKDPEGQCLYDGCVVETMAILTIARYSPQIIAFLRSVATPLGQMGVTDATASYQEGEYKVAFVGFVTAGEFGRLPKEISAASKSLRWGDSLALVRHTADHASDFGLKPNDYLGYAKASRDFIAQADSGFKQGGTRYDSFIGKDGKTYFFDNKTSTFGVRNSNGTTATAYKPKGGDPEKAKEYWNGKKRNMSRSNGI